jgi:hypothetical protein
MPELISVKIRKDQREFLDRRSYETHISICEIVREAIDATITRECDRMNEKSESIAQVVMM